MSYTNKTMQLIRCPLCKADTFTILFPSTLTRKDFNLQIIKQNLKNTLDDYRKHAQIVRCNECQLVYTNPMEDMKTLLKGYDNVVDEEYLEIEPYRKKLSLTHLKLVERYKNKGNLLDVGCFAGFFLELARQRGWKTSGIEPSRWARKIAEKKGITIVGTNIETAKIPPKSFDVITLWDVIEHLSDPQKVIQVIHKSLKKDGVVAIGTPNIESILAKILKENYPYLIRMHIILFSPKTLRKLLEENGFRVITTSTYGRSYPLSYVVERIQMKNFLFRWIKKIILSNKILANSIFHIDLKHEFVMIAKKTT